MRIILTAHSTIKCPDHRLNIPYSIIFNNRNKLIKLLIQNGANINAISNNGITPLRALYYYDREVSPEVHKLLWSSEIFTTIYNKTNTIQLLCSKLQFPQSDISILFLNHILSKFKDIYILYNALMYKSQYKYSGYEYINKYGNCECKNLTQILINKVKRIQFLMYISAIKKNKSKPNNTIQLCLMAMNIKFKNYLGKQVVNKI